VSYGLFHESRFDYDAGKRSKRLFEDLPGSNLITRTKVVVIGTMPGTPLEERTGWRLAQALEVPYLELSNVNIQLHLVEEKLTRHNGEVARRLMRSNDWRQEAETKSGFPSRVGDMVRRFFSKNKYNGYVIEMLLDRWETYDPLFEEARDIVWVELSLGRLLLQLARRVAEVLLLRSTRPMLREDLEPDQEGRTTTRRRLYTEYWYNWRNLVCFWDENRSLLAKTISLYYKNLQTAPFLLDHNGQLECWHIHSTSQLEAFLVAVKSEKTK